MKKGSYISISASEPGVLLPSMLDPVLQRHQASLSGSAYITFQLSRVEAARIKKIEVSDKARIGKFDVGLYGVLPSMFESTVPDFLNVDRE